MRCTYRNEYCFKLNRATGEIVLSGVDLSGSITLAHDAENYQVWRVSPGHVYSGLGQPWLYVPARLWLVKMIESDGDWVIGELVREVEPGHGHKKALAALIAESDRLND